MNRLLQADPLLAKTVFRAHRAAHRIAGDWSPRARVDAGDGDPVGAGTHFALQLCLHLIPPPEVFRRVHKPGAAGVGRDLATGQSVR